MKTQSINIIWLVYKGEIKKISKCDNYFKILHHKMIQLNEYKDLYKEVGVKYKWLGRIHMDNKKLEEIILDSQVEIHLMKNNNQSIGFFEIDYRKDYIRNGELRSVHFGLIENFIGKGLGVKLMDAVISRAHELGIKKIVLQTNSLDHSRALPFYKQYGFKVFSKEKKDIIYSVN